MPFIDIAQPYYLILLLLLPYLYIVHRRSHHPLASKGRLLQLLVRCLMVVALILGLAGVRVISPLERLCVIFALDTSPSMPKQDIVRALDWIEDKLSKRQSEDIAGLVVFDSKAGVITKPQDFSVREFRQKLKKYAAGLESETKTWATDIGSGLELAASLFPPDYQRRVVLISDGNHNTADMLPQLVHSRTANIKVDVLALGGRQNMADVWIDGVHAPPEVRLGQGVNLDISLSGNLVSEASVSLFLDDDLIHRVGFKFNESGQKTLRYPLNINKPGNYLISAEVSAASDTQPENNYGACWVRVYHKPRLLYVTDSHNSPSPLLVRLDSQLPLDVIPPAALETTPLRYQNYGAIILENISAFSLTDGQQKMLMTWVHDLGNGLVIIGGDNSFGPGGYMDTPLEKVSPVEMQAEDKDRKKTLGMVLVLDKSKSMNGLVGGRSKLELATDAAAASLDWFKKQDLVGVVAFDIRARSIVPLTSGDKKSQIIEKLKTIIGEGKTNIYPGLSMAYKWLREAKVDIKHILLLSDGKSKAGDFELLLNQIADEGITVSVVGVGPDCDRQLLGFISQNGGGRMFLTNDYSKLRRIFFKDLQIASKSLLRYGDSLPQLSAEHEILEGVGKSLPVIHGYVATTPKPNSRQLIVSATGEPVLSVWNYGLGKVAAFTGDGGEWIGDWFAWPHFSLLWRQITGWAAKAIPVAEELRPNFEILGDTVRIWVDALTPQGKFKNGLNLQAKVIYPDLSLKQTALPQIKPGLYQAHIPIGGKGTYTVKVFQLKDKEAVGSAGAGFVVPYLPEARGIHINQPLLNRIASVTQGRILGLAANPFAHPDSREHKYTKLDTVCLLTALILFLLEIVGRKFYYFAPKSK